MAVPDFQTLMLPLLQLTGDEQEHSLADAIDGLARKFQLSDDQRQELLPSGRQPRFDNRVGWAVTYLKKAGLLRASGRGRFQITDRGKALLASPPSTIDINLLTSRFPEMADFRPSPPSDTGEAPPVFDADKGTWALRPGVQDRIREKMERVLPAPLNRRSALELLAYAIENADEEREDAWYLRETATGIALVAGRMSTCKIARSRAELETQKGRAPAALGFRAAQIVLGAKALFSDQLLQNLLDSSVHGGRTASEAHHLFPQAWFHGRGIRDRRVVNQVANLADVGWHENTTISAQSPAKYVPRLREKLEIDDEGWGRLCAEHALPMGWESMEYPDFLRERRRRMADLVRIAYRKLGGEPEARILPPPWFLSGSAVVWQRIVEIERALRAVVRDVYVARFGDAAIRQIEAALPEQDRGGLTRALRARPVGADPLTVVDYLYLAQLPPLLFAGDVWQHARQRFGTSDNVKQRLQAAIAQITPVRNEIAHVREVVPERLQRASLACSDVLEMMRVGSSPAS